MSYDLTRSDEQRQILDAATALLTEHYPLSRLRGRPGPDPMQPLAEFGAFALALPEPSGGAGFSVVEEALLHVALGRHLVAPSALASALGARIAFEAGEPALAGRIASGAEPVAAGIVAGDGLLLFDRADAGRAVIFADGAVGLAELGTAELEPRVAMGHGRPVCQLAWDGVPLAGGERVAMTGTLLVAAQLLGVAEAARDLAVAYSGLREQFGRPIGSFQAIKHHCANMTIGAEKLSALLDMAAIALRDERPDAGFQLAALGRIAPRVALENARLGTQIHGGIGFSAEAEAHLFVKHAHLLGQIIGRRDMLGPAAPLSPYLRTPSCESP